MTTFVMLHGAYHGGWCWDLLVPELEARGHRAIAMDLPCDDPEAGHDAYLAAALAAIDGERGEHVCVLGHSLGGFTVPLVASACDAGSMLFLCTAPVLNAGELLEDEQALANGYVRPVEAQSGTTFRMVPSPLQYDETPPDLVRAPDHGEQTDEVLLELGLDMDAILDLKIKGAVL